MTRHNIEIAMKKLQLSHPDAEVNFWGKIEGIASGLTPRHHAGLPHHRQDPVQKRQILPGHRVLLVTGRAELFEAAFAVCRRRGEAPNSGRALPRSARHEDISRGGRLVFRSDSQENAFVDPNNLAALIERANKKQNLKEIHRVAEVVRRITSECLIVPKNCYKLKTGNFLEKNKNFKIVLDEDEEEEDKQAECQEKDSFQLVNPRPPDPQKVCKNFSFFQKPSNRQINKFLALKDSKDFREYFEIDYFPRISQTYHLGTLPNPQGSRWTTSISEFS